MTKSADNIHEHSPWFYAPDTAETIPILGKYSKKGELHYKYIKFFVINFHIFKTGYLFIPMYNYSPSTSQNPRIFEQEHFRLQIREF